MVRKYFECIAYPKYDSEKQLVTIKTEWLGIFKTPAFRMSYILISYKEVQ